MRVIGGQSGNQAREFRAVASGALLNGEPVIVNSDGTVSVVGGGNLTAENFAGFTGSAYSDTQTATIQSQGAINDKQSALTPGQVYYVQTDGTLGTTPDDPSVFAGTAVATNKIIVEG